MNWADKMIGTDLIDWKYAALYNIIILLRCSKFFLFISCIYIQFGSLMLLMGSLDVYIYIYMIDLYFQSTCIYILLPSKGEEGRWG